MGKRYQGELLGTLRLQSNACTEPISVHPIQSGIWNLVPADEGKENYRHSFISLIVFDKRQVWSVYFWNFGERKGWDVERKGLCLRMPEKDFEKFFGKYEIIKDSQQ